MPMPAIGPARQKILCLHAPEKSKKIDMISGATYTSQGYVQSLQSALDKAGLK